MCSLAVYAPSASILLACIHHCGSITITSCHLAYHRAATVYPMRSVRGSPPVQHVFHVGLTLVRERIPGLFISTVCLICRYGDFPRVRRFLDANTYVPTELRRRNFTPSFCFRHTSPKTYPTVPEGFPPGSPQYTETGAASESVRVQWGSLRDMVDAKRTTGPEDGREKQQHVGTNLKVEVAPATEAAIEDERLAARAIVRTVQANLPQRAPSPACAHLWTQFVTPACLRRRAAGVCANSLASIPLASEKRGREAGC